MRTSTRTTRGRATALLATAATTALVLTGCSSGGNAADNGGGEISGTITLQTWALTPTYTDYLNGVIDDFEQAHPDAKVKLQDQPGDGYADKVLSQASSNSLPDVINLPPDIALPLAKRGFLQDVGKDDSKLASTYVAGAVDSYKYKGVDGTFGYPWYLNTDVNYWNATMFDKCGLDADNPPKTTDELFEQAKTMHENCPTDYLMSRKPGLGDFTLAGVKVLNADGTKFTFADSSEAADLIDRYKDAYQDGYMPSNVLNSDYLGNSTLFTQAKVAWTTGGATSLADFEKNNPSLKGKVTVSPALDTPPLYVQGLSVSSKSKHLATAEAFAKFMTNAKNQEAFAHQVNIFPSTTSSQSDPYFSKDDGTVNGEARVLANEALKSAKVINPVEANSAMTDFLDQQIALAMKGQVSPEQALQTAQTKMNSLLANG
ncbi:MULTISPECIES: sugar ABC transporter substrate-binding protein [unclassified Curtobacterium]|uniref:ABC transporter substrate-binding protein n=1 Tax=unclassified Curtobacterium TaxID=257496 RepID=UPI0008DD2F16|nr:MULTISPECIES: sugar ABC transporter substrate-binding protein [unclassified Curtobacterium]OIH98985.1 sugar ABC transporter substrate-binding protein [Curtobacterium sp. MCBA15_003]OII09422.1 sugar ABC transporter substrate-binding protein [Curtobacterium sp. MCBA15_009]OII31112.1 sugar ABC transporter substrate-binding protein [Curtobacterium sp. MMLR14_006]